ncbi:MAG: hypothetical protein ACOX8V_00030 [Thermoleophilia bacterium]
MPPGNRGHIGRDAQDSVVVDVAIDQGGCVKGAAGSTRLWAA